MAIGKNCAGVALLDVIFACGLMTVIAAIAIPSVQAARDRDTALLAARYVATRVQALRMDALRRNRSVALWFDPDDLGHIAVYHDGDGDGVREQDIDDGIDPAAGPEVHVARMFEGVSVGVPINVPTPEGNAVIAAHSDPIRIGNTNLLSFSGVGSGTSGTIYLAGRSGTLVCVRVLGTTGRVRVLRFHHGNGEWRPD